jgi:hypothetical protein
MRVLQAIAQPITTDAASIAALQAQTSGTPLTLNGDQVTTYPVAVPPGAVSGGGTVQGESLGGIQLSNPPAVVFNPPRPVTLTSAANLSAGTFTVAGYDVRGLPISEVITGPNANTVSGKLKFAVVTSVTPNTTSVSTVSVGNNAQSISRWITLGEHCEHNQRRIRVLVPNGVTVSYTVEATSMPMNRAESGYAGGEYPDDIEDLEMATSNGGTPTAGPFTSSTDVEIDAPYAFVRINCSSLTGGNVTLRVLNSSVY